MAWFNSIIITNYSQESGDVMFKTETHLHVSEVSPCAKLSAAEMVKIYHEAGYKTLIISDHFHSYYFSLLGDLSWDEKVDRYLSGYKAAKEAAEKYSMNVLFSAEISLNGLPCDYLCYGVDESFLKKRHDLFDMTIEEFYPYAKENGITVVQAHPYRDNYCFPTPEYVDAFEVYNTNPRHENYTEKCIELALAHNKPMTAGSDAHRIDDAALTGVLTENEICSIEDYLKALFNGELKMIKGDSTL